MTTKDSQISYQAYSVSQCLDRLIEGFGDRLEGLTAIDKLDLIAILASWQSTDTEHLQSGLLPIGLTDYLGLNSKLRIAASYQLDQALEILDDCSDGDAMTLLVTLTNQLRDGVFAE